MQISLLTFSIHIQNTHRVSVVLTIKMKFDLYRITSIFVNILKIDVTVTQTFHKQKLQKITKKIHLNLVISPVAVIDTSFCWLFFHL